MQRPRRVGSMSWQDIDLGMRRIVRWMAVGITADLAGAIQYGQDPPVDIAKWIRGRVNSCFQDRAERWLPQGVGWIGAEGLRKRSSFTRPVVVTVQALEGAARLEEAVRERRLLEPGEVACTLGMLVDGEPIAGYICDVRTHLLFGRKPYDSRLVRLTKKGVTTDLAKVQGKPAFLSGGPVLCYDFSDSTNPLTKRLLREVFGEMVQVSGSLGLAVMRVLTGEAVAVLRPAGGSITPWSDAPIAAMCSQGDLVAFRITGGRLIQVNPVSLVKTRGRPFDMLYVGRRHLGELRRHVGVVMI